MYLKSIELSGFKSFAKKNVFQFDSPISAIVGPNGSGKSNVAEAFRFVLGEQSIKSMRGKRGEDLIWNGASSEPRANRASVKVIFDNSRKIFDVDFSEVIIERVVHRDGLNEYSINGSPVRLKDIVELLARAHIGASGHHIISQGEADRILAATPKDRKSMIEDALGLKLYQYKKQESERKMKRTSENIAQVEALRKEIAPHLRFLKKQVEKLEKTDNLRHELLAMAKEYFSLEEAYLSFSRAEILSEKEPLDKSLKKLAEEMAEAKVVLEKGTREGAGNSAILELEKSLALLREEKDGVSRELGRLEGLVTSAEEALTREKARALSNGHKLIELKEVEELFRKIEKEREDERLFERIKHLLADFIRSKKDLSSSKILEETQVALARHLKGKNEASKKFEEILEKEKGLEGECEALKLELEKEKDSSHDAEKNIFRIMSKENEIISKLNLLKAREEKLSLEEKDFKRELEEALHLAGPELLHYPKASIQREQESLKTEIQDREKQEEKKRQIGKLKVRLEDSNLSGGEDLEKEYKETKERDGFLEKELLDLDNSAKALSELIKELEVNLAKEFALGLEKINKGFQELFTAMFGGGEAKLFLTKENTGIQISDNELDEPVEGENVEGLDIKVSLPKKKIRGLMMLSGGERALTSIALIFAVSQVNPPPFIILDETDAALDESNSKKYGDLVEKLAKHSQLILITHNRETMSRAGVIYGVTMGQSGVSRLLSISFDEAVETAK